MTHLMQGEAIHRHHLAHDDLHDDLGDDDDDTNSSHTVLAILLLDGHRHAQQVYLLTVRHDDYLLLIKWKWIVIKAFILTVLTLRTLRRGVGLSSQGWKRPNRWRRWEGRLERQAHSVSLYRNTL